MPHSIPDAALERHIGILGKTGSGKSNTAKTIAERIMYAGGRVVIIDPTGTWWGIRLRPDGLKNSKFEPVIFGGNHADIPISGEHGALIAEAIATASSSAIIDTRLMTVGQRTRFFTAFAEALLRHNNGPLTLIIDEAHLFAPQGRANDPQSGAMVGAANNLVSLGRGIGLRIILISQRPAKLHKDSLTQVETLVAMRLIAPQDRRAIEDWIGEWADPGKGKEITASLPSLPTGTAWVWSPEIEILEKVKFPLAATFDSGKAPSIGDAGPTLTPIDVKAIGAKMDAIRQDAAANDPVRLKAEIARLQRQIASNQAATISTPDPAAIEEAERRGYERARAVVDKRMREFRKSYEAAIEAVRELLWPAFEEQFKLPPHEAAVSPSSSNGRTSAFDAVNRGSNPREGTTSPIKQLKRDDTAAPKIEESFIDHLRAPADPTITPAKRRILAALRDLDAIGHKPADKMTVAWFADASPKSSAFANNLGALRSAGLIEYPGQGTVGLTADGEAAEPPRSAPTHEHIMALVGGKLTPALRRMLDAAVGAYPNAVSTADLAEAAGASTTSSAFANNRGRLRSLGLIDYPSTGMVRAADLLFPGGR